MESAAEEDEGAYTFSTLQGCDDRSRGGRHEGVDDATEEPLDGEVHVLAWAVDLLDLAGLQYHQATQLIRGLNSAHRSESVRVQNGVEGERVSPRQAL